MFVNISQFSGEVMHREPVRLQFEVPVELEFRPVQPDGTTKQDYRYAAGGLLALVHAREEAREQYRLARTDELTGLPNRRAFNEDVERYHQLVKGENEQRRVGMGALDLDNFKDANDKTKSHTVYGDALLCWSAEVLEGLFKPHGKLYRVGGDEFIVLFNRVRRMRGHPEAVMEVVAAKVRDRFKREYQACHLFRSDVDLGVSMSIGRSQPGESPQELVARLDSQMYEIKAQSKAEQAEPKRLAFR